ncbi:acyl-CoA carboxylase epsilon subunit [Streptomyces sp. NPDC101160]|uniref:acyl-CoA carboxylase epsilon subunit n=1 Tax=Streptomyces sp. NPDC101160 TaxID=3366118 RepID=UPI0037F96700
MFDLRIERGTPTAEELAALTAVLAARLAAAGPPNEPTRLPVPRPAEYLSPLSWQRAA